ncbi:MAG: methyltransferase [Candidatus Pacebacteria bacterium]|nr:methyltransferase [Candidatus Paceibacterota bacterium]
MANKPSRQTSELVAMANRAAAAADAGDHRSAINDFYRVYTRAASGSEIKLRAARNLANCYLAIGAVEQSLHFSMDCLRVTPHDPRAAFVLAQALIKIGTPESARQAESILAAMMENPHPFDPTEVILVRVMALGKIDRNKDAADLIAAAIAKAPKDAKLYFVLGEVLDSLGQTAEALTAFNQSLRLDPTDRMGARAALAILQGESPDSLPPQFVSQLFDDYASRFDGALERLGYQVPQLIFTELRDHLPRERLLDLGCGTGLVGQAFAETTTHRTGIDLSPRMIEQARRRGCYQRLEVAEITQFLSAEADGQKHHPYDLVIAADVLVYCGELKPIFKALRPVMRSGGLFAFTLEAQPDSDPRDYSLAPSKRFRHRAEYVNKALESAGFKIKISRTITPRFDQGQPVEGYFFLSEIIGLN